MNLDTVFVHSGVVKVDVKLKDLDINQCDMEAWVPNAFKNTHRCDRETTYCEHYPEQVGEN